MASLDCGFKYALSRKEACIKCTNMFKRDMQLLKTSTLCLIKYDFEDAFGKVKCNQMMVVNKEILDQMILQVCWYW